MFDLLETTGDVIVHGQRTYILHARNVGPMMNAILDLLTVDYAQWDRVNHVFNRENPVKARALSSIIKSLADLGFTFPDDIGAPTDCLEALGFVVIEAVLVSDTDPVGAVRVVIEA